MRRGFPSAAAPVAAAFLGVTASALFTAATLLGAPAVDRKAEAWVRQTLKKMTLEEKVGQLVVPGLNGVYTPLDSDAAESSGGSSVSASGASTSSAAARRCLPSC
jgi:hypothetical protein